MIYDLESFYNAKVDGCYRKIGKIDQTMKNSSKRIARLKQNPSTNVNQRHIDRAELLLGKNKSQIYGIKDRITEINQSYNFLKGFDVTEKIANDCWVTNDAPTNVKTHKGFYCNISSYAFDHLSTTDMAITHLRHIDFLYGETVKVPQFGRLFFQPKFLLKDNEWDPTAEHPSIFFNMNNHKVRSYIKIFERAKTCFTNSYPEWIDNSIFLD